MKNHNCELCMGMLSNYKDICIQHEYNEKSSKVSRLD